MRSLKLALLAATALAVFSSAAAAADLIVDTPVPVEPAIDNTFTWDGAYIGAFVQGQSAPTAFGLGVDFGVNALMNGLLLGGEFEATASVRPAILGAAHRQARCVARRHGDPVRLFGRRLADPTSWYVPVGVGVEFALAQNLGLKAEAQYNFDLTTSGENSAAVKVGLNWHF